MKRIKDNYLLYLIFLVALFFRFYNFPTRYGFDYDAMRDSLITHYIVNNFVFPLIGPPVSVGNFTFGPWYYYLLALGEFIFRSPFSPWIVISLLSLGEIYIFYRIGKELENKWLGYIYAVLLAVSASQIILATGLSNPNLVPFFASTALLIFIIIVKRKFSPWLYVLFGFILGMGILAHYQMAGYMLLPLSAIVYKRTKWLQCSLLFILGFVIVLLPLIVVNILTHGQLFSAVLAYLLHGSSNVIYIPNSWKIYLIGFWSSFWPSTLGLPYSIGLVSLLFTCIVFIILLIKKKLQPALLIILFVFLLNFIYFRFYQGERTAYYTYYLQPFIFLFFGYALYTLSLIQKIYAFSIIIILLCIILMTLQSFSLLSPAPSQIAYMSLAHTLTRQYQKRNIILYSCKSTQLYRTEGLVFALQTMKIKGSETPIKLGIQSDLLDKLCSEVSSITTDTYKNKLGTFRFVDISNMNDTMLYKKGWVLVNEKKIYNAITQWWYPNADAYPELRKN